MGEPNIGKMKKEKDLEKLINTLVKHKVFVHEELVSQEWERTDERRAAKKAVVKLINTAVKDYALVFGHERVVEGLINILVKYSADVYGKWRLAKRAAIALGEIGDPRAVEPLIEVLTGHRDEGYKYYTLRMEAAGALGKIADPRAVEPLIEVLGDNDYDVRVEAAKALGKIGDPRAVEPLIVCLVYLLSSDEKEEVAKALVKIGPSAVKPLIKVLKKPPRAYGQPPFRYFLSGERRQEIRAWAAEVLGKIGDPEAVEPLIKVLRRDKIGWLREAAAEALGKKGDLRALWVRETAAEALGRIGDPRAVKPLEKALQDKAGEVHKEAKAALNKIRRKSKEKRSR